MEAAARGELLPQADDDRLRRFFTTRRSYFAPWGKRSWRRNPASGFEPLPDTCLLACQPEITAFGTTTTDRPAACSPISGDDRFRDSTIAHHVATRLDPPRSLAGRAGRRMFAAQRLTVGVGRIVGRHGVSGATASIKLQLKQ